MRLYLKQHLFSWKDRSTICDEISNVCYYAQGEFHRFEKKLHLYDSQDHLLATIRHPFSPFSWRHRYFIERENRQVAEMALPTAVTDGHFRVRGPDWEIFGSSVDSYNKYAFSITMEERFIARISREPCDFGNYYYIYTDDQADSTLALAVILCILSCIR